MVVVKLVGGLASQLHKYAVGRALAELSGSELLLDISNYVGPKKRETQFNFELDKLQIKARLASEAEIARAKGLPNYIGFRIAEGIAGTFGTPRSESPEKLLRKLFGHTIYKADITKSSSANFFSGIDTGKDAYIYGEWGMGSALFDHLRGPLVREFTPRMLSAQATSIADEIAAITNSISLHVRRGDYVKNPSTASVHGTCPIHYYRSAIEHITKNIENPRFFVFSDDIAWSRESLAELLPADSVFVENLKNYEDFHLLGRCAHNITANSGFSALSAWANDNPDKIVITPRQWVTDEKINAMQLSQLPREWVFL